MDFKLSFKVSINDDLLLDSMNDYMDTSYQSLKEISDNDIIDYMGNSDYVWDALDNIMVEDLNIEKV